MAEEPPVETGSLFVAEAEPEDLRPYRPQSRHGQPAAAPPPVEPSGDFGHLSLRRNKQRPPGGPAYNPRALAQEAIPVAPSPVQPPRGVAQEPFEAVGAESFHGPAGASRTPSRARRIR